LLLLNLVLFFNAGKDTKLAISGKKTFLSYFNGIPILVKTAAVRGRDFQAKIFHYSN
jgi:hypothetical protein